jgi:hypothetical protein
MAEQAARTVRPHGYAVEKGYSPAAAFECLWKVKHQGDFSLIDFSEDCLEAGLVDEMHLAVSPILLGTSEHLFAGLDLARLGFRAAEHVPSAARQRMSCS